MTIGQVLACCMVPGALITMGVISVSSYYLNPQPRPAEVSQVEAAAPTKELPERNLTAAEQKHNDEILKVLRQQWVDALTPRLSEWVKENFTTFENSDRRGIFFSRSVAWGKGKYKGQELEWFAYTAKDGYLQMNLSVILDEKDIATLTARGKIETRIVPMPKDIGMVTHLALTEGGATWVQEQEFCLKNSYVCNTAGAFERYLLSAANKAMPGQLAFTLNGRFPY